MSDYATVYHKYWQNTPCVCGGTTATTHDTNSMWVFGELEPCEYDLRCDSCDAILVAWAYGYWELPQVAFDACYTPVHLLENPNDQTT